MPTISTSRKELQDLTLSWLAVSFAFSLVLRPAFFTTSIPNLVQGFIISLLVVGTGFVLHELMHKFTAQRFGFWSEFRANYTMLIFSVFLAYIIRIVFAAPGATLIYGRGITKKQNGVISASGPLLNLGLAGIYLLVTLLGGIIAQIGYYGFIINIWLSAFNLLPISVLDGKKVLAWGVPQYIAIAILPFLGATYVLLTIFS
ncbi:MAG TPA: site-2 protease family protein [Candidatus Acidoferrales bacterium]|nr:site-2 protease family protein [Candidatus Acidoferrales bacterium]